jgi:hypothetical protein
MGAEMSGPYLGPYLEKKVGTNFFMWELSHTVPTCEVGTRVQVGTEFANHSQHCPYLPTFLSFSIRVTGIRRKGCKRTFVTSTRESAEVGTFGRHELKQRGSRMKCPPTRRCLKCNPSERAMYVEPKPVVDRVACPKCQDKIPVTQLQEHIAQCQPQGSLP